MNDAATCSGAPARCATERWYNRSYQYDWTVAALLDAAGARYEDAPALHTEAHGTITHAEIRRRAAFLRGAIARESTEGARSVGCLVTLDAPWFVAVHGILTSGLAYAALEPEAPDARLAMSLEDCGAGLIVADAGTVTKARRLAGPGRRVIQIEEAIAAARAAPPAVVAPAAPAAFIFTSGSTGRPKAVVRSPASLAHAAYCLSAMYEYAPGETMLYPGSAAHVGSLNDALCCLLSGFRSLPVDIARVDLARMRAMLIEERVDILAMPPSLLRLLVREMAGAGDRTHLRCVVASGEALLRSDVGLFYDVLGEGPALWQNYGSTETGPMYAGRYTRADANGSGPLPLRVAHRHCAVEIIDESGATAAPGEVGEVVVRSEYLAAGYLNAPPEQARRFGADSRGRFFRIGDRGSFSASGELFIAGRADRQIKLHGRRFELGDIESAIMSDRSWAEAAAVHLNDSEHGSRLCAVVRPAPGVQPELSALRERLATLLPPAAIPHRFVVVGEMPRTDTGKLDLARVAAIARGAVAATPAQRGGPPQGAAENWVADTWQYVLGIDRPGREDRFQDLGGDSLAAIELSLILEKRFGLRLSLDRLVELQTIAAQVAAFEQGRHDVEPVRRLRTDGAGPVCVLIPGVGGHAWVFAELARRLSVPCDVQALSLVDLAHAAGGAITREGAARAIAAAIDGCSADRPIIVGGFSFGAIVASDVATFILSRGGRVDRMVLLDPSPLDSRRRVLTIRERLRESRRARSIEHARLSAPALELDREVFRQKELLYRLYTGRAIVLPDRPTSMIVSADSAEQVRGASSVLGRPLSSVTVRMASSGHLDILRLPRVEETAEWLDEELSDACRQQRSCASL